MAQVTFDRIETTVQRVLGANAGIGHSALSIALEVRRAFPVTDAPAIGDVLGALRRMFIHGRVSVEDGRWGLRLH